MTGNFAAGQVIRPGKHDVQSVPLSNISVAQGDWLTTNVSGHLIALTSAGTTEKGVFMALESFDNSAGAAGAVSIQVAGSGSYVTAVMGTGVSPGSITELNGSNQLESAEVADIAAAKSIGTYKKLAGGQSVVTTAGDIGVIHIGGL